MPIEHVRESLANLKLERDAIILYDSLSAIEKDPHRAAAFRHIAASERRHEQIWAERLREQGVDVPEPGPPRPRVRVIIWIARVFGTRSVSDLVQALEGDEEAAYAAQAGPEVESIAADERLHAALWKQLAGKGPVAGQAGAVAIPLPGVPPAPAVPERVAEIARRERWHHASRSGTLRASIFGVNDGLVSNLALVMGVAGATAQPQFILLAGVAGLLAGAFSMAAGEWISMQSQRELFERQIALERAELEAMPEEEEIELALIYRSKGFSEEESKQIAHRLMADPEHALDTLVRQELGLDPDQLGSPWGAAIGSFVAFALGATLPVLPYLFAGDSFAFWLSLGLSIVALFGVGAAVSLLTGRSTLFSGFRQATIGGAAAAITYVVGSLIGISMP